MSYFEVGKLYEITILEDGEHSPQTPNTYPANKVLRADKDSSLITVSGPICRGVFPMIINTASLAFVSAKLERD